MGTESELEILAQLPAASTGRSREDAGAAHAPLLASRAVQDGRPSTLDRASLVHLQASAGNSSVAGLLADEAPAQVRSVLGSGGGERLDPTTAADMSARLGVDLSSVRIHRDTAASESAQAVHANAYTVGDDIVFRAGHFDPSSPAGQRTLAHELTHVIQQRAGAVEGTDVGGGLALSHPSDRFEREASANAERVMAGAAAPAPPAPVAIARSVDATSVQRGIAIENVAGDAEDGEDAELQREGDDDAEETDEDEMGAGLVGQRETDEVDEEEMPS